MKKILFVALLGLMTIANAMAAIDNAPVSMTITLKNGNTVTYAASNMDSVRFVGGKFGDSGAIGMKIYLKGQTQSIDYLYSQITDVVEDTQPVVSSNIFTRVTNESQLVAGKRYIIVCEGGNVALPNNISSSETLRVGQLITINDHTVVFDDDDHGVGIFTLCEGYTLKYSNPSIDGTYYLSLTSDTKGLRASSSSKNWSITIDDTGNALIVANDGVNNRKIRGFSDNNTVVDFRTYMITATNGLPVQLYKEDDSSTPPVTLISAPVFSPNGGMINTPTEVTIHCDTEGASIYYTTDGSTPSASSTLYTGAIIVSATTNFKAIAIKDGESSAVTTVTFTYTDGPITDNNVNRNALSGFYNASKYMYRLEWPRIKEDEHQSWLAKSESGYGLALEMEWDNSKIANRFTCYYLDHTNTAQNVGRKDSFKEDPELPESTRSKDSDYSGSGYARGHLCPSADRRGSQEQQALTYFYSNMQPQWQKHNGGQWSNLEEDVRTIATSSNCDTLYVVKAATIDDITLNGNTESGVYSSTYNGVTYANLMCNSRLKVSKYFYMAVLAYNKTSNTYQAMGIWTKHFNGTTKGADGITDFDWPVINKENAEYITIDELEQRTGLDFFCNLPDDIEDAVEATFTPSYWTGCGISLNK